MLLNRVRTQSRAILLPVACFGLLLTHSQDFVTLSPHIKTTCHLTGFLLFVFVLWNISPWILSTRVEPRRTTFYVWADAATTIAGITLLLINRFAPMTNLSHGLCDIAGWTLILFCFFSPSSRWQSISFSSVYLILLSGIHWKKYLSIYQGINAYVLIAIFLLWLAVSALTYLFLSRRQQLQRQQD